MCVVVTACAKVRGPALHGSKPALYGRPRATRHKARVRPGTAATTATATTATTRDDGGAMPATADAHAGVCLILQMTMQGTRATADAHAGLCLLLLMPMQGYACYC